ncbi:hypothetical protein SRHO_G00273580 [Serrasalmus rhombeus]
MHSSSPHTSTEQKGHRSVSLAFGYSSIGGQASSCLSLRRAIACNPAPLNHSPVPIAPTSHQPALQKRMTNALPDQLKQSIVFLLSSFLSLSISRSLELQILEDQLAALHGNASNASTVERAGSGMLHCPQSNSQPSWKQSVQSPSKVRTESLWVHGNTWGLIGARSTEGVTECPLSQAQVHPWGRVLLLKAPEQRERLCLFLHPPPQRSEFSHSC